MTHVLLPRASWTTVPRPTAKLARLISADVRGVCIHWPGSTATWGQFPAQATSARRLEDERRQHTSPSPSDPGKPWTDIAYSLAVDLAGRVFDCRGIDYRPAANGDVVVNSRWVAMTVLMGAGDQPTPAAVEGVRFARSLVLDRYPGAVEVVGHRSLHPTECPGPGLSHLIETGAFTGSTTIPGGDDMPTAVEIAHELAHDDEFLDAVASKVWVAGWPAPVPGDPDRVERAQDRLVWAARGEGLKPLLDTLAGQLRVLQAEIQQMPGGTSDVAAIAGAVVDELARRTSPHG